MKNILKILAAGACAAFMFCCCEPLKEAFGVNDPEQFSKVYMPLSINGTLSYDMAIDEAEEQEVKIYANIGGLVKTESDLIVKFRIEKDSLDVYNTTNGTDYKLLPDDVYEFTDSIVTIPAGQTSSSNAATVSIHAAKLPEVGKYLLPVKLVAVEGGDFEINQDRDMLYIMIDGIIIKNSTDYPENYPLVYATTTIAGEITATIDEPVETEIAINANIGGTDAPAEDVKVTFAVDEDYLKAYNEENQTGYRLLPADAYSAAAMSVTIPAGSSVSDALSITVNSEDLVGGPFMLPLRITEVTGEGTEYAINEDNDIIDIRLRLNYEHCVRGAGWTAVCPTTEPTQGALSYLFDGDLGTFWCTQWNGAKPTPPHVLTVDMQSVHEVHGVAFTARVNVENGVATKVRMGMVHKCEISLSYDNQVWTSAGEFELPFVSLEDLEAEVFFDKAYYGRYIKINVTSCYEENGNVGCYQCGLSEFNIFGREGENTDRKPILTLSVSEEEKIKIQSSEDVYDRTITIRVKTDIAVETEAQVTFELDTDYVSEYNSANGTEYKLFGEGTYTVDKYTVTIPAGATESEALTVTLKPSQMSFGEYILPLKVSSVTSDISWSDLKTQILASYSVYFARTGWSAECNTTEVTAAESEVNLFDGNTGTHWCTQWTDGNKPNPPHVLIIDMSQVHDVNGLVFSARINTDDSGNVSRIRDGVIKECEILFSNDEGEEKTWTSAGTYSLPYVTKEDIDSRIFFDTPHSGRYVKVNITKCYKEGGTQEFYQCQLSEINIF